MKDYKIIIPSMNDSQHITMQTQLLLLIALNLNPKSTIDLCNKNNIEIKGEN